MSSDPQTIPAVLDHIARELPDHKALVTPDCTLTFAELRGEVRRAAAAMIALGVNAGDRVAIWSPNTHHWVLAALGAQTAGATLVPVNIAPVITTPNLRMNSNERRLMIRDLLREQRPAVNPAGDGGGQ